MSKKHGGPIYQFFGKSAGQFSRKNNDKSSEESHLINPTSGITGSGDQFNGSLYCTSLSQSFSLVYGLRSQALSSCRNNLADSRPRNSIRRFSACPSLAFMSTIFRIDTMYESRNSALLLVVAAWDAEPAGSV